MKKRNVVNQKAVKKLKKKQAVKQLTVVQPVQRKLAMTNTFVSETQLAFLLGKTPTQHIYERPAKGGGKWTYVTGVYVTKVLNYVFGWNWDFQIVDKGREGNLVWVQGRLQIRDDNGNVRIIKEQFGRADVKMKKGENTPLDYGNDLKSASTDALKKCASELGIAGDVYGKNEFKDLGVKEEKTPVLDFTAQTQHNHTHQTTDEEVQYEPIKETPIVESSSVRQIKLILKKKGAQTAEEALKILEKETGLRWKNFTDVREKAAELALKAILNK
ncbi:MAG TPA: hypothetical protein DDY21_00145 [Candidatus Moranbacteria bacterium]|nr:hypothetical protein [Candidatus Moranbacteria bacterium]